MRNYTVIFRDDRYNVTGAITILHTTGKEQAYARAMSEMRMATAGAQIVSGSQSLAHTPDVFDAWSRGNDETFCPTWAYRR